MVQTHFSALSIALVAALLTGCASLSQKLKADPAPDAGFLAEPERMSEQRERFPFHRVWVSPAFQRDHYRTLMIPPVDTGHLLETSTWAGANLRASHMVEDTAELAEYTRTKLVEVVTNDPSNRFRVVDAPGPATLILELALVEIVPGKAVLAAMGQAVSAVGVPGVSTAAAAVSRGTVAIEGRLRDGASNEVLVLFADRESGKSAPIDLDGMTWYGHAHEIIDDWAAQLVELANTPPTEKVADSPPFKLSPW